MKKLRPAHWNVKPSKPIVRYHELTHFDHTVEFAVKAVEEHNAKYEQDQLRFVKVVRADALSRDEIGIHYTLTVLVQDGAQNWKLYIAQVINNKNEARVLALDVDERHGDSDLLVQLVKELEDSEAKRAREEEEEAKTFHPLEKKLRHSAR